MSQIASRQQLRMSYLRWAFVTVPLVLLLGVVSSASVATGAGNAWYAALAKPAVTPPDAAFAIVWTILYVLMGLALAMVLNARGARLRGLGIVLFVLQFIANLVWTPLFFGAHQVVAALVVLMVMLLLALATTLVFGRIRAAAAWLLVPYLAWLCFAGALTWRLHQLNPDAEALVPGAPQAQIVL